MPGRTGRRRALTLSNSATPAYVRKRAVTPTVSSPVTGTCSDEGGLRSRPACRTPTVAPMGQPRRGFAMVLVIAMAASTFALAIIAVLAADLIAEFDITREQLGSLVTVSALSGAVLAPLLGPWADHIGARNATLFSLAVSAVAMVVMGVAPTFPLLIGGVLLTGVTQAITNPATNKLISSYVDRGRRGVVMGVKQSGVQAGNALGGAALPAIALAVGWRWGVLLAVLFPVAGLALAMWSVPGDVKTDLESRRSARASAGGVRRLAVYGLLLGLGGTAIFTYLPLFGQEALGLDPVAAGSAISVSGVLGVIGRIGWGRIAETSLGSDRSLLVLAGLSILVGLLLVAAPTLGSWVIWPVAALAGLSVSSWNSVGMLAIIERVPVEAAGKASGTVMLGFLGGLGLGAPIFGRSVDILGDYRPGWIAVTVMFVLAFALWLGPAASGPRPAR